MEEVKVYVKIEPNEWMKFNFIVGYKNPVTIFMTFIGIIIVLQASSVFFSDESKMNTVQRETKH